MADKNVDELKAELNARNIEFGENDRKSDLVAKLEAAGGSRTREGTEGDGSEGEGDGETRRIDETVPGGRYIDQSGNVINAFGERIK